MSIFDDFCSDAFKDSALIIGEVSFKLGGNIIQGIFNEHSSAQEVNNDGMIFNIDAAVVCHIDQFSCCSCIEDQKKLEKEFQGKNIVINNREYRIHSSTSDTISVTFNLVTPRRMM